MWPGPCPVPQTPDDDACKHIMDIVDTTLYKSEKQFVDTTASVRERESEKGKTAGEFERVTENEKK